MPRADAFEKPQERSLLLVREVADGHFVGVAHLFVELGQDRQSLLGDVAEDLATVGRRPLAPSKAGFLELVEQSSDARCRVDHAVANHERRHALGAGAAKDAEHVVLLNGEPRPRDDLREVTLDQCRGSQNADGDLGLDRMKWPILRDLDLERDGIL